MSVFRAVGDEMDVARRAAPLASRRRGRVAGWRAPVGSAWSARRVRFDAVARLVLAAMLPISTAVALVPLRNEMINANVALALMVVVVSAAAVGGRAAGAVAASSSALAYDFWHTRPYLSLRMTSWDDVETTVLLLLAGLIVGTVAWQALQDRVSAQKGRQELRRIHRLAGQVAAGDDPADVILAAEAELSGLLDLRSCRFEAPPYDGPVLVRLERGGSALEMRLSLRSQNTRELPPEGAELQVLSRGQPVGRFVLLPKSGSRFSLDQRVVAVALADQVGAALATRHVERDGRERGYG